MFITNAHPSCWLRVARMELPTQIEKIHEYLRNIHGAVDKAVFAEAKTQQYELVLGQIKAYLPIKDPEQAAALINTVSVGPWEKDQKENLMLLVNGGVSGGTPKALRPRQNCNSFSRYLTSAEADLLQDDTKTVAAKVDTLARRMWLIGLVSPSEMTAAQVLATAKNGLTA